MILLCTRIQQVYSQIYLLAKHLYPDSNKRLPTSGAHLLTTAAMLYNIIPNSWSVISHASTFNKNIIIYFILYMYNLMILFIPIHTNLHASCFTLHASCWLTTMPDIYWLLNLFKVQSIFLNIILWSMRVSEKQ